MVLTSCGEKSTPPGSYKSIAIAEPSVMEHTQVMTVLRRSMDDMDALGEVLDGYMVICWIWEQLYFLVLV